MQNYHLNKIKHNFSFFLVFPAILCFFAACSNLDIVRNETTHEDYVSQGDGVNDNAAEYRERNGTDMVDLLLGNRSDSFNIGVDNLTFNVILDSLSFMPLASVDSTSGVVVTDWYSIDENKLRIKINARIIDDQLTDDSITVQMFKQEFDGQRWNDIGNDIEGANKIKNKILSDARALKTAIDLS